MEKIQFQTNVSQELALKFTEGKECQSNFGPAQWMFTTCDDRVFFVAEKVAQKIHGLHLRPGECFDMCKAEVPYSNGRKGIEWQISRVGEPMGEQPNGTFVVPTPRPNGPPVVGRVIPVTEANTPAPAPVVREATTPPVSNGNGSNKTGANPHVVISDGRPKTRLEDALKTVVAAVQATHEYAKSIGYAMPQFTSEDLRTMANTLMIASKNGGANA